jgi:hypothetical protein
MDCTCVYATESDEYLTLLSSTHPKARKQYKCDECRGLIAIGETYRREVGTDSDGLVTYRTCSFCAEIRDVFFTCGFTFCGIIEDFRVHIEYSDGQLKSELIASLSTPTRELVLKMIDEYIATTSDEEVSNVPR